MNKKLLIINLLFLLMSNGLASDATRHIRPESFYQTRWCRMYGGVLEYELPDLTRVDCMTRDYAVEFDFAKKWAESIGQSLYYAKRTGRRPAVALIIERPSDIIYFNRILPLCNDLGITLIKITP